MQLSLHFQYLKNLTLSLMFSRLLNLIRTTNNWVTFWNYSYSTILIEIIEFKDYILLYLFIGVIFFYLLCNASLIRLELLNNIILGNFIVHDCLVIIKWNLKQEFFLICLETTGRMNRDLIFCLSRLNGLENWLWKISSEICCFSL